MEIVIKNFNIIFKMGIFFVVFFDDFDRYDRWVLIVSNVEKDEVFFLLERIDVLRM